MNQKSQAVEKKHRARFLISLPIPYTARVLLILVLIIGGFVVQFTYNLVLGVALIAVGSIFGSTRSIKCEPKGLSAMTEWIEVMPVQWDQAEELTKKCKHWKRDITNLLSGPGGFLFGLILFTSGIFFVLMIDVDTELTLVFVADSAALFVPLLLFGTLSAWEPPGLLVKLKALQNILKNLEESNYPDLSPQPMMGLTKGDKTKVPIDARLMIRLRGAPENFYGVQVQVTINTVQSTQYPYLYAVITCSQEFPLDYKTVRRPSEEWLVLEPSKERDVIVLVLRQKTTKTSGYHTNEARQIEVVNAAVAMARQILRSSA